MSGIKLLYQQELFRSAPLGLGDIFAQVRSGNRDGTRIFEDTLERLGCDTSKGPVFSLSNDGTSVTITDESQTEFSNDKVITLCCILDFLKGKDVALPFDAPRMIDTLAEKYGCKAIRYLQSPADNTDSTARQMSKAQFWLKDGIMASLKILSFMKSENKSLTELTALVPSFATVVQSVDINLPPPQLLSKLDDSIAAQAPEGIIIFREHGSLLIKPSKAGKSLKVYAEAGDVEIANELCAEVLETLLDSKGKTE